MIFLCWLSRTALWTLATPKNNYHAFVICLSWPYSVWVKIKRWSFIFYRMILTCSIENSIKPFILVQGWLDIPMKVTVILNTHFANLCIKSPESKFSNRGFQGHRNGTLRSSRLQMLFKLCVLKVFAIFTRKHLFRNLFLKKGCNQVFSCEYCETFKNRFFYRTLLEAASDNEAVEDVSQCITNTCRGRTRNCYVNSHLVMADASYFLLPNPPTTMNVVGDNGIGRKLVKLCILMTLKDNGDG